jgi:Alkaline and neutral invertase
MQFFIQASILIFMSNIILSHAISILENATIKEGIKASVSGDENYDRIWARDAVIAGIAGILSSNNKVIEGFKSSIVNLAKAQGNQGQLPSNIKISNHKIEAISYGGLAGRVDATTWWIIGASILCNHINDTALQQKLQPNIEKAFKILEAWEFNQRGLMYIPLGGNWADEYLSQGYTLYDQLLRIWALRAASKVWRVTEWTDKANYIEKIIVENYFYSENNNPSNLYHPAAYKKACEKDDSKKYWWSALHPNGYDTRWDMPANALALLLNINDKSKMIDEYIKDLSKEYGHWLLPVFHPVVKPNDKDWNLLENNYSFRFKNIPHHFHNGGSWFIFLGMLGMGLCKSNHNETAVRIFDAMKTAIIPTLSTDFSFSEYWTTDTLKPGGTPNLCFTAAGIIFIEKALENNNMMYKNLLLDDWR